MTPRTARAIAFAVWMLFAPVLIALGLYAVGATIEHFAAEDQP